ncbi:dehydratase [Thiospirochaeta perfilievii]|uniref:Dehydratase n=1 Tax=Thiospirochaeta perfilievii TaxID=252967 RepID=A0A5C1QJ07_9SPIO|nr:MaoC/PaaZ C-terminal domain-containing protein [Thiospirochaeta perfilievii]QEN06162.1 dehydratase [Thiospirochaeta perfilievii]
MSLDINKLSVGDIIPEIKFDEVTQVQLIKYAGAAGDFNPIHTVPSYAKEAGLDGTIAHGMLIMGMLGKLISDWSGIKHVTKYGVSFKSKTVPGDTLIAKGEIKKITPGDGFSLVDCKVYIEDTSGDVKVDGKVTIKL